MKIVRTAVDVCIALSGPALTLAVLLAGNREQGRQSGVEEMDILSPVLFVAVCSGITAIVSIAVYHHVDELWRAMVGSVAASEVLCIFLMVASGFVFAPNQRARNELLMWFPIVIIAMFPFLMPLACTVSYGIGRIVRRSALGDMERGQSPSLAAMASLAGFIVDPASQDHKARQAPPDRQEESMRAGSGEIQTPGGTGS